MSILINKDTKVVVQGITGKEGAFHTKQMISYGTQVIAGVTPGKGGKKDVNKIPIYNTLKDAKQDTGVNTSIVFVPPSFAADACLEGIDAELDLIICITEGIPIKDMVTVKNALDNSMTRMIGPNCPGIITPGIAKINNGNRSRSLSKITVPVAKERSCPRRDKNTPRINSPSCPGVTCPTNSPEP